MEGTDLVPKKYSVDGARILAQITVLEINNQTDYDVMTAFGKAAASEEKIAKAYFEPKKKLAYDAYKIWVEAMKDGMDHFTEAKKLAGKKMAQYVWKIEQARQAEADRIEAERIANLPPEPEEGQIEMSIDPAMLGSGGMVGIYVPEAPTVQAVSKAKGVSTRTNWKARITNKGAFLRWVVDMGQLNYVDARMPLLNSAAKAGDGEPSEIPGVEFFNDASTNFR